MVQKYHRFGAGFLAAALMMVYTIPVFASGPVMRELSVSRRGDTELACGALSKEAAIMRDIVFTTQDIQNDSAFKSRGISAAGTAASFLIGTVTGGIGIAAAGFLMDRNMDTVADNAEGVQDIAQQRRSLMMGIYNAKGCYGPIEHAMRNPEHNDFFADITDIKPAAGGEDEAGPSVSRPRYNP